MEEQLSPQTPMAAPSLTPLPPLNPTPQTQKSSKLPIIILSFLFLIALGFAVFFGYKYFKTTSSTPVSDVTTPAPTVTPSSPTPLPDPTSDWKTYTDSEYKFSFMYPSDWKLNCLATELPDGWLDRNICDLVSPKALLDHGQISNGSYFVVGVSKPNPNYANFTEYIDYSSKQFGYTFKDRQINNISGKIGLTQGKETNYLFERNGHLIIANWIYSENSESIDQILSTFKFTN